MQRKIVVGLLVICCLLLVGCEEQTNEKKNSKKDFKEDKTVKELMDKIEMPLWSIYYEAYYVDELNASDIPNDGKLLLASSNYRKKNKKATEMTKEELKEELVNIFGTGVSYTDESIQAGSCYGDSMSYQDGKYTFEGGCGGVGPVNNYQSMITDAREKDNKIIIKERIAYISYEEWERDDKPYIRVVSVKRDGRELARESSDDKFDIEEYIDQLDEYQFTFEKENDVYIFKSVKKL